MPRRSAVEMLPPDTKAWLDQELVAGHFSGYEALAAALAERGFEISKSSLHRYGTRFEEMLEGVRKSTEMAKAFAEACPDDGGAMSDALIRLVQEKAFQVLMDMDVKPDDISLKGLGHMIADISRGKVAVSTWAAKVKASIGARLDQMGEEAAAGKRRLDAETLRQVREEIYGLVG